MQTLDFKIAGRRARSFSEEPERLARHHTWVAIGVTVVGGAVSAYGANKQAKAVQSAANQNAASQDAQNQSAWASYLMSRGVNPSGAATGQIPSNPQAINTKLPLWATANFAAPGAKTTWRKKGSMPAANTLSISPPQIQQPTQTASYLPASSSGSSKTNDILIGNPLGIGGKDRNFFDPLGIF